MKNTEEVDMEADVRAVLARMGRPPRLFAITPDRSVLLIIDMQNAFCADNGCIEIPEARSIVPNINRISACCREKGVPVIFVGWSLRGERDHGLWPMFQPRSPVESGRELPPTALTGQTSQTDFFSRLDFDKARDHVVWKRRYSPFAPRASRLPALLRRLRRDTLLISGVGTNVCCESTARDAMMRDFRVVAVSDANATVSPLLHEVSLMNIRLFFGDVVSTDDVLDELGAGGSST